MITSLWSLFTIRKAALNEEEEEEEEEEDDDDVSPYEESSDLLRFK